MHESIPLESSVKFTRPKHLELITGIIILLLIVVIGITSLKQMITNSQIATASNTLIGSLNLARSEAMARNKSITICPTDDGISCGNQWENGWLIFIDNGTAGFVDEEDTILKVISNVPPSISFSSSKNYIKFDPKGNYVSCKPCEMDGHTSWMKTLVELLLPGKAAYANENSTGSAVIDQTVLQTETELRLTKDKPETIDNALSVDNQSIVFSLCDTTRSKETGRLIQINHNGKISSQELICD